MHGDGTKLATTLNKPAARLLEMTRVLGLQARRPTGVDRVCVAYLRALIAAPEPCFGLVRTGLGFVLLDQNGMRAILARLEGRVAWGAPDILSRLRHRRSSAKRVSDADVRRLALARCRPMLLGQMLRRRLPPRSAYINVDQTNLSERVLAAVKSVPDGRVTVFLHDMIPLDYPAYQTPDSAVKLRAIVARAQRSADLILTNSEVSKGDIERHMAPLGPPPPIVVAHLGVEVDFFQNGNNADESLRDGAAGILPKSMGQRPYLLCLGTIEPRKNHQFLVALWEGMAATTALEDMPHLVICGRRGWHNETTFEQLDHSPLRGQFLHEFNDLDDTAVAQLIRGARALVFPSFAEGFGLPPVEAAAAGVPVICNDLPIMREILGDYPIYAGVTDSYSWEKAVQSLAGGQPMPEGSERWSEKRLDPPGWAAHFNTTLRVT